MSVSISLQTYSLACCTIQPDPTDRTSHRLVERIHATEFLPVDMGREVPYVFARTFAFLPQASEQLAANDGGDIEGVKVKDLRGLEQHLTLPLFIEEVVFARTQSNMKCRGLLVCVHDLIVVEASMNPPGQVCFMQGTQPSHSGDKLMEGIILLSFGSHLLLRSPYGGPNWCLRVPENSDVTYEPVSSGEPAW